MGAFGDIAGGIADLGNTVMSALNYGYQRRVQEKTWDREDTAVQRRVADLKAAGLSPTLAAGSAAQTSSPIRLEAPRVSLENTVALQAMKAQRLGMVQTQAEIDRIRAATDGQKIANQIASQSGPSKVSEAASTADLRKLELQWVQAFRPVELRRLEGEAEKRANENELLKLRREAEKWGITERQVDVIRKGIETKMALSESFAQGRRRELEFMALRIANRLAQARADMTEAQTDQLAKQGFLPTGEAAQAILEDERWGSGEKMADYFKEFFGAAMPWNWFKKRR